jgi:hypothetical protein
MLRNIDNSPLRFYIKGALSVSLQLVFAIMIELNDKQIEILEGGMK